MFWGSVSHGEKWNDNSGRKFFFFFLKSLKDKSQMNIHYWNRTKLNILVGSVLSTDRLSDVLLIDPQICCPTQKIIAFEKKKKNYWMALIKWKESRMGLFYLYIPIFFTWKEEGQKQKKQIQLIGQMTHGITLHSCDKCQFEFSKTFNSIR